MKIHTFVFAIGLFFIAESIQAQVGGEAKLLHQFGGPVSNAEMGRSVSNAGDVDGDGFDDVIVGAPGTFMNSYGAAFVYSGTSGSLLYQLGSSVMDDAFGYSVSGAGDLNGDGFDDLIVGAYSHDAPVGNDAGAAYVFSGATGALMYSYEGSAWRDYFGFSVSDAGDVNADGFSDFIIGAFAADPGAVSGAGSAFVYSGITGTLLRQYDGESWGDNLGKSVSSVGDVNSDGFDDVLVGAVGSDPSGFEKAGSAYVFSGSNNAVLFQFDGAAADSYFGTSVASAGDVNGDGFTDFIVGAAYSWWGTVDNTASVFCGTTGSLIYEYNGDEMGVPGFAFSLDGVGDIDEDGCDDFVVGSSNSSLGGFANAGSAFLFSGATGALMHRFDGAANYDNFGVAVSKAGDVNGDDRPDIIIGAHTASSGGLSIPGVAYVWTFNAMMHASSNTASVSSGAILGFEMHFPMAAAFYEYKVLLSATGVGPFHFGVDIPLAMDSFVLNSYYGIYPTPFSSGMQGTLDSSARGGADIGLPQGSSSALIGRTFWFAAIANQPGQLPEYSSIAIPITIVP